MANYHKAYSQIIHPIPDKTVWNVISERLKNEGYKVVQLILNPPKSQPPPGRPCKNRVCAKDGGLGQCTVAAAIRLVTLEHHVKYLHIDNGNKIFYNVIFFFFLDYIF